MPRTAQGIWITQYPTQLGTGRQQALKPYMYIYIYMYIYVYTSHLLTYGWHLNPRKSKGFRLSVDYRWTNGKSILGLRYIELEAAYAKSQQCHLKYTLKHEKKRTKPTVGRPISHGGLALLGAKIFTGIVINMFDVVYMR